MAVSVTSDILLWGGTGNSHKGCHKMAVIHHSRRGALIHGLCCHIPHNNCISAHANVCCVMDKLDIAATQSYFVIIRRPERMAKMNDPRSTPLWSSVQSSWPQTQRFRVRFPALPDFVRIGESGTASTQPDEDNWGAIWMKNNASRLESGE
jgi:hypothetical protein